MKFMHLGDLHIGKRVNEVDLLADQKEVLRQVVELVRSEKPDCVLIAGDVYDKPVPSAAAVTVLDGFLTELSRLAVPVCLIAGNHDSPERLQFGSRLMAERGVHIQAVFEGQVPRVEFSDAWGPVHVYLLPFVKPAIVRGVLRSELSKQGEADEGKVAAVEAISTYEEAVKAVLSRVEKENGVRSVLVAHQFVTAAGESVERSDSEIDPVGGLDQMDYRVFDGFDYVALGHLHGPQRVGRESVRYGGSLLKYSFSEVNQRKGVTIVELKAPGSEPVVSRLPLSPLRDMRVIKGPLEELCRPEVVALADREDYVKVILTDEKEILDAMGRVRQVYPNVMELAFERADHAEAIAREKQAFQAQAATPSELFERFYERQNGRPLEEEEKQRLAEVWEQLGGEA